MIVVAAISVIVVPVWQYHYSPVWLGAAIVAAVAGVLVMTLAPRAKWDRLFWYPGGIAQRLTIEPEPKILRWAGVTAVRAHFDESDDSIDLDECTLDGPDGVSMAGHPHGPGPRAPAGACGSPSGPASTATAGSTWMGSRTGSSPATSSSPRPPRTGCPSN